MVKISQAYLLTVLLTPGEAQNSCKKPRGAGCFEPCLDCAMNGEHSEPWEWWKNEHKKSYETAEIESYRRSVWEKSTEYMMMINAQQGNTFSLGWNADSDLTDSERRLLRHGSLTPNTTSLTGVRANSLGEYRYHGKVSDLPSDWDWSEANTQVVTPVKSQKCGDCWAHAASEALEGALAVAIGWTTSLAPQQFVDCTQWGCKGGAASGAVDWAKDNFACSWDSYVETGKDGTCNMGCDQVITPGSIWGHYSITHNDEGALCSGLIQRPIAISVAAGGTFGHYKGGILSGEYEDAVNHGVLAVGYGWWNGIAYWKIKNSWGTSWGIDGYALLFRGGGTNQNHILDSPFGVYVYGPYNPSMQLTNAKGLKVSAPAGPAPMFTV